MPERSAHETEVERVHQQFDYHPPTGNQAERYMNLRFHGRIMAAQIMDLCPGSAERSTALRKLREVVMWANASIACNEAPAGPWVRRGPGEYEPAKPDGS
jgi:hypothetical protein